MKKRIVNWIVFCAGAMLIGFILAAAGHLVIHDGKFDYQNSFLLFVLEVAWSIFSFTYIDWKA